MRKAAKLLVLGTLSLLGAGLALSGCKSGPDLPQADALAMIQAKYDATSAVGANITVNEQGLRQGVTAKYWDRTKLYPNKFWADFTLTAEGKKAVKLRDGSDVIKWRPLSETDKSFSVIVVTVAANHPRAHDLKDIQAETLPGVETAKGVQFMEGVNLDGAPAPLVNIAHNPGNKLSTKRQADFALENGAWKLHSIE